MIRISKIAVSLCLILPATSFGLIYQYMLMEDPRTHQKIHLFSDLHMDLDDLKHTLQQSDDLLAFIQALQDPKEVIVEDMETLLGLHKKELGSPSVVGNVYLPFLPTGDVYTVEASPLVFITPAYKALGIPVYNAEFRSYLISPQIPEEENESKTLQEARNNYMAFRGKLEKLLKTENEKELEETIKEFEKYSNIYWAEKEKDRALGKIPKWVWPKVIERILKYNDGRILREYYASIIKKIASLKPDSDEFLAAIKKYNVELLDIHILHRIYRQANNLENIIVVAGGLHISNIYSVLKKMGYVLKSHYASQTSLNFIPIAPVIAFNMGVLAHQALSTFKKYEDSPLLKQKVGDVYRNYIDKWYLDISQLPRPGQKKSVPPAPSQRRSKL
jgi:hypothetical protein